MTKIIKDIYNPATKERTVTTDDGVTRILFFGYNSPFSNFYLNPNGKFAYKDYQLDTSEQGFMLEKALMFDPNMIPNILKAHMPRDAKALGRQVKNYNNAVWNKHRRQKMYDVCLAKFSQPTLKKHLLATGDALLIEASPYDRIWGTGFAIHDNRNITQTHANTNLLGKVLMDVRETLRQG